MFASSYFNHQQMKNMMRFFLAIIFITAAGSASAQLIHVMTYNIRYDNPGDSINQWGNRKQKVFQLLKKYNPDILGVQEALYHQLIDIQGGLNGYSWVGVGRDDGKQKGEYSAIFYKKDKFEVVQQNTFWLSETPDVPGSKNWDAAITRVATWAILRDLSTRTEFLVINTHFDHIGAEARAKSAALIKAKMGDMLEKPVILTGDLNCLRDEAAYPTLIDPATIELMDPAPQDPPGTFCSFKVNSIPCRAIDYILHTNQWLADSYRVIQDNDGSYYPSDHLPVMVTLTLQER
jgi:endonuclease/exonuclease/phosphatase family metal-dependent hydrolase